MAKTESVLFKLGADVSGLTKGLAEGRKGLKDVEKGADGLANKLLGLAGILGVGLGFGAAAKEALEFADATKRVSDQTGLTTDAVQRLAFIASQTGNGLTQITAAIARMQNSLVKAAEGTKAQAEAFEALKIDTAAFFRLNPEDQFRMVSDAIAGMKNPADQTAAAMAVFGKSGAELLPTLKAMSTESDALNAKFESMGGPMSAEAITALDDIGDAASTTGQTIRNLAGEILGLAAPAILGALEGVTTFFAAMRHAIGGGSNEMVNLDMQIQELEKQISAATTTTDMYGVSTAGNAVYVDQLRAKLAELQAEYQALADAPMLAAQSAMEAARLKQELAAEELVDIVVMGEAKTAAMIAQEEKERATLLAGRLVTLEAIQLAHVDHEAMLEQITKDGFDRRTAFEKLAMSQQASNVFGALASITAGVAQHNKALFNLNKAAGIANAIINTAQGVSKTLGTYPMPLAAVMAAVHAAAGIAQVQAIKSQSFNGGGAGIAPSQAATPPTPVAQAGGGQGGGGGGAQGGELRVAPIDPTALYSGKMVKFIADQLVEHQKNGGTVLFQ